MVTLYRLAVTVPRTSLEQTMFFWLCRESMRSTSTRLASLTWISTVPSSLTATSDLLTMRPSGLGASTGGLRVAGSAGRSSTAVGAGAAAGLSVVVAGAPSVDGAAPGAV